MADTVWTAQHDAKADDLVKVAGLNANGTANLSRFISRAGEDVKAGDEVLFFDDDVTVVKRLGDET